MKKNICCLLSCLILISVLYICLSSSDKMGYIKVGNSIKFVDSEVLLASNVSEKKEENNLVQENVVHNENVFSEEAVVYEKVEVSEVVEETEDKKIEVKEELKEELKEEAKESVSADSSVTNNEIITGKMTGYGPDCYGCSGYLAYGMYVGDGTIYYNDSEYGKVRIVAGDKKYKFGTIVKINDSMLAIVLDRGGSIGIGKKFLFDLLYPSEKDASTHGVMKNVKFEILRNGF